MKANILITTGRAKSEVNCIETRIKFSLAHLLIMVIKKVFFANNEKPFSR